LIGDSSKAKRKLPWKPKVSFSQLVKMMVDSDMALVERKLYGEKGTRRKNNLV